MSKRSQSVRSVNDGQTSEDARVLKHVLTAVMRQMFGSPRNLEMHLGENKSKCDYAVSRALTPQDTGTIEETVNEEIEKDHRITAETLPIEEAQAIYDLVKVPEDATAIRIVHIGDLDATPCRGEHVAHTRKIGRFRIKSYTMKGEGTVRLRFTVED